MSPPALTLLSDRLAEVSCLLRVCRSRRSRKAINIAKEEPALLRGALVLLCSHIEGFFEDLVADVITAFDENAKSPEQIPTAIRSRQLFGDIPKWASYDHDKRWSLIKGAVDSPLFKDGDAHVVGIMDADIHTGRFANPGTAEIKELFRTIGIDDCWSEFSKYEPGVAYKGEIDAIVSRRNQVAHGDLNAIVTDTDISAYILNFEHTAKQFGEVVTAYLKTSVLAEFEWNS